MLKVGQTLLFYYSPETFTSKDFIECVGTYAFGYVKEKIVEDPGYSKYKLIWEDDWRFADPEESEWREWIVKDYIEKGLITIINTYQLTL